MANEKTDRSSEYAQEFIIKFRHPGTDEEIERVFLGDALMTPDEFEEYKDLTIEEFIIEAGFGKPFDYQSPEAQKALADKIIKHHNDQTDRT